MIMVKFKISETDGDIRVEAGGGNIGRTSKLERDFVRKFLAHANQFNTNYKKLHRGRHYILREKQHEHTNSNRS